MHSYTITLSPRTLPRFIKVCPRCGCQYYENSGCFRVNANGKRLDIWLVARCEHCKTIWNLGIYERIDRARLDPKDYQGYLENNPALVLRETFNPTFLSKNRAVLDLDGMDIRLFGDLPKAGEAAMVFLRCACPLPISAGRAIANVLGVSLSHLRRMQDAGELQFTGDLRKSKVGLGLCFSLVDGWYTERTTNPL